MEDRVTVITGAAEVETGTGTGPKGGQRPTGGPVPVPVPAADTEVTAQKRRRRLTKAYKLAVLAKIAEMKQSNPGQIGEYLRSESLYYGSVREWRALQLEGELTEHQKGSMGHLRAKMSAENARLKRQLASTKKKLEQAELLIELQKKVSQLIMNDMTKDQPI
jgi:transposase